MRASSLMIQELNRTQKALSYNHCRKWSNPHKKTSLSLCIRKDKSHEASFILWSILDSEKEEEKTISLKTNHFFDFGSIADLLQFKVHIPDSGTYLNTLDNSRIIWEKSQSFSKLKLETLHKERPVLYFSEKIELNQGKLMALRTYQNNRSSYFNLSVSFDLEKEENLPIFHTLGPYRKISKSIFLSRFQIFYQRFIR